jgi:two-component system phosphate regulon sensor histidine kinase PhoR
MIVPFNVERIIEKPGLRKKEMFGAVEPAEATIGFAHPITYRLHLQDTTAYLFQKISPQIFFSVLLLGLTIFSFLTLYRNLLAQQKLAAIKNEFISNITHELKTPIATVSVAIEAMKNFKVLEDPNKTKEYLDISQNELQRLSLLVDKVLKLSMFEKKEIELKIETVDLKLLVEEVAASMRLQLEKQKAKLTIQSAGDTTVEGDRLHFMSVIFNLLDNALKYSNIDPSIQIDIHQSGELAELAVSDNGIGIPAEYRQKIFEKFFRVPSGNTHNAKGYGLGLSYVAHVVNRHQGHIAVESQPGIGSRFIIKLPRTHG